MIRIVGGTSFQSWKPKAPVTLGGGCAISDTLLLVYAFPDSLPANAAFTRLFYLNTELPDVWRHTDWTELVVSTCLQKATADRARAGCSLSEDGAVEIANSTGDSYERIEGAGLADGSRELGRLTAVREIAGALYACGGGGQVYRRARQGRWSAIDDGLAEDADDRSDELLSRMDKAAADPGRLAELTAALAQRINLADIDGTAADDIYVCGLGGRIFHFDGSDWSSCRTPGTSHLNALHCASKDIVVAAGHDGAIWSGNRSDGFTPVAGAGGPETFWTVRRFRDDIFAGSSAGLFRLGPSGRAVVAEAGLTSRSVIQQVDSFSDAYLWIVTDRHAVRFDGEGYEMFRHPDNG